MSRYASRLNFTKSFSEQVSYRNVEEASAVSRFSWASEASWASRSNRASRRNWALMLYGDFSVLGVPGASQVSNYWGGESAATASKMKG